MESGKGAGVMTDLHCHLLPAVDDGAENEAEALELLRAQYQSGVRNIALTSHFDCERDQLDGFLRRRAASFDRLRREIYHSSGPLEELQLRLGAEVAFSPNLCRIQVERLCLEGTPVLLLELPGERLPLYFEETVRQILGWGITPLIAHVERYPYVLERLSMLCDWIDWGCYVQVNGGSLLKSGKNSRLLMDLIRWNLIHVAASDAHHLSSRPPNLKQAMEQVERALGAETAQRLRRNAAMLFAGELPKLPYVYCPRRILGRWR